MKLGNYELNQIYIGDSRELTKFVPDNSIDLIFTDPPYLKEFLPLYEWLAVESARILKPSGFLLTYTGGYWKNFIFEYLGRHLEYFWDYTLIMSQDCSILWPRRTIARAKSLLCYRKRGGGGMPRTNVLGSFTGGGKQKNHHIWGQDEETARYYIDCFSDIGDVVFEPFTGGGTTCAVCKIFGRQFLGFEIDQEAGNKAIARVNKVRQQVHQTTPPNNGLHRTGEARQTKMIF